MAAPVAGPSRVPYVEVPVSSHSHAAASTSNSPARVPVNTNGSSHGSTTQESSNLVDTQNNGNGTSPSYASDDDDSGPAVTTGQATYSTSDAIVHRAFRPRTGYCYSTKMTYHAYVGEDEEDVHPEEPDRIVGIHQRLQDNGLLSRMDRIAIREAVKSEATLIHSAELWHKVNSFANQPSDFYMLNRKFFNRLSLYVNEHTALCARLSLGGVIETCRAVADGRIANAFAIVRPPGHHAEPEQAMGFCFYNNAAVAAAYLKTVYREKGIRKILILDWDVHHGNGTQKAFWSDPDVLYISIHRYDNGAFYPGGSYGAAEMVGGEGAEGRCVNIPWPTGGMRDADYIAAFQKVVMPIAYEFRPDFVLVSAGFDAAEGDQLGGCHVSPGGYAQMTHMLSALAGGRMVIALEGGYNVDAISNSALECVKVLLGELPPEMPPLVAQASAVRALHLVTEEQSRHWRCIQPTYTKQNELANAGKITPVTEILKAHRTSYLYDEFGMYNVPLSDPKLEQMFKDQLLVSDNLFSSDTLVLLVHDMGNLRAELNSLTADVKLENSFLLDTSRQIVEWTMQNQWALVDVNVLAHSDTITALDRDKMASRESQLVLHVWDTIVKMAENVDRVVLIGQSVGCNALINLLNRRGASCVERVKAAVQLFDMHPPLALIPNAEVPGIRGWYKKISMAVFPTEQQDRAERVRVGNRFAEVLISRDPRPTHVLHDRWPDITNFISGILKNQSANARR